MKIKAELPSIKAYPNNFVIIGGLAYTSYKW